jgi:uncharacterized membrane protein
MARKYNITHIYDTEAEAQSAKTLLNRKFSASIENIYIIPAPYGFILQIDTKEISDESFSQIKAEIEPPPKPEAVKKPVKPTLPSRPEAPPEPAPKPPEPARKPIEKKPKEKRAEKPPKPKPRPKPSKPAKPVTPAYKPIMSATPKRKSVAVCLAVFLGLWSWLYTYKTNKRKFWLNFILTLCTLGGWSVVSWVWAIVDAAAKPAEYYQGYPDIKADYPKKAYFLASLGSIIALVVAIVLFGNVATMLSEGNSKKTNTEKTSQSAAVSNVNAPVILTPKSVATSSSRSTINSKYVSAKAPAIDGALLPGEWPEPSFNKTFTYSFKNVEKKGIITGYFFNDDGSLYVAITVTTEDFKPDVFQKENELLALDMFFDENNDGILRKGEDNKKFWGFEFQDAHQEQENKPYSTRVDKRKDGEGACVYSNPINTYVYECRIPLNSGDTEDLAVKPGDTIGIRVVLSEYKETEANKMWKTIGSDGWPTGQGWIDGIYGQLVLAQKPSSAPAATVTTPATATTPATIVPTSTTTTTTMTTTTTAPTPAYPPIVSGVLKGELTANGEVQTYSFQGNNGDVVFMTLANPSGALYLSLKLYDPSGKEVGSASDSKVAAINMQLKTAGTYTIKIRDNSSPSKTGPYTLSFNKVSEGKATPITTGPAIKGTLTVPGETQFYAFSGTAGDTVLMTLANPSGALYVSFKLYDPNGNEVGSSSDSKVAAINTQLKTTGTYTIRIRDDSSPLKTGPYTLSFDKVSEGNAFPITTGPAKNGSLTIPGEAQFYAFSGTAGDAVFMTLANTGGSLYVSLKLYDPNGNEVGSSSDSKVAAINTQLKTTGTYTIRVRDDSSPLKTGPYTLSFDKVSDGKATPITSGPAIKGTLTIPGEAQFYAFSGTVGDTVFMTLANPSGALYVSLKLYDPNGNEVGSSSDSKVAAINTQLKTTGTYTIRVRDDSSPLKTGPYTLSFDKVSDAKATPITTGPALTGYLTVPGEAQFYAFSGTVGDVVFMTLANTSGGLYLSLKLYDPNGNEVGSSSDSKVAAINIQLKTSGTYTIRVRDDSSPLKTGPYTISFDKVSDGKAPLLYSGPVVSGVLATPGESQYYSFQGKKGDTVSISLSSVGGSLYVVLKLYDPNGNEIGSSSSSTTATIKTQLKLDGIYTIRVRDDNLPPKAGFYNLILKIN